MTLDQYFDYMGLRFNAPQAEQDQLADATINWIVSSADGSSKSYYSMELLDYTLPYTSYDDPSQLPSPTVTVIIGRPVLDGLAISENPVTLPTQVTFDFVHLNAMHVRSTESSDRSIHPNRAEPRLSAVD